MNQESDTREALAAFDPSDLAHVQMNFGGQSFLRHAPRLAEPSQISANDLFPAHLREMLTIRSSLPGH
jgi:hypothetical protein